MIRTCAKSPRNEICNWLFWTIPKYRSSDRSVGRRSFSVSASSNRYEIVADNVPVECDGFSYKLIRSSRISKVYSFTEISFEKTNNVVEIFVVRL